MSDEMIQLTLPSRLIAQINGLLTRTGMSQNEALVDLIESALVRKPVRAELNDFAPDGMRFEDLAINTEFLNKAGRWRVTDIGSRTIAAIKLDPIRVATISKEQEPVYIDLTQEQADKRGFFNGPPYTVSERIFNEDDFRHCSVEVI